MFLFLSLFVILDISVRTYNKNLMNFFLSNSYLILYYSSSFYRLILNLFTLLNRAVELLDIVIEYIFVL